MDRATFVNRAWKAYSVIDFKSARMDEPIPCMVVSIDFDNEIFELQALDAEIYQAKVFVTSIEFVHIQKRKLSVATLGGKKVEVVIPQVEAKKEQYENT